MGLAVEPDSATDSIARLDDSDGAIGESSGDKAEPGFGLFVRWLELDAPLELEVLLLPLPVLELPERRSPYGYSVEYPSYES